MNHEARQKAGSAGPAGNRPSEPSNRDGLQALEIRERLAAIVNELENLGVNVDVDVPLTLARGLLEGLEAA